MTRPVVALVALVALTLAACDRPEGRNEAKRMPNPPPSASSPVPADLRIAVEVDGAEAQPLTAAMLATHPADFAEADRRAWRIDRLVPAAARDGASIAVTGERNVTIALARPEGTDAGEELVAVLTVSRRGEVHAALVEPTEPFPPFHGRGGRLGRPGNPLPRIAGVTKITVRSAQPATDGGRIDP